MNQEGSQNSSPVNSHKELIVWQKGMTLVEEIYSLTKAFPPEERYGLASQMRRAAVSIPSNIAEGRSRNTRKDFIQFLHIALDSTNELETQLELASRLSLCQKADYNRVASLLLEVKKMQSKMLSSLKAKS